MMNLERRGMQVALCMALILIFAIVVFYRP